MSQKTLPPDFVSPDLRSVAELRAEIERLRAENAHLRRLLRFRARRSMETEADARPSRH